MPKVNYRIIIAAIITIVGSSCTFIPQEPKEICKKILSQGYEYGIYDCSNMSYDLCVKLEKLGYDCRIIHYDNHAIVELIKNGHAFYYDPTLKQPFISKPKSKIKAVWTVRQVFMLRTRYDYAKEISHEYTAHKGR